MRKVTVFKSDQEEEEMFNRALEVTKNIFIYYLKVDIEKQNWNK